MMDIYLTYVLAESHAGSGPRLLHAPIRRGRLTFNPLLFASVLHLRADLVPAELLRGGVFGSDGRVHVDQQDRDADLGQFRQRVLKEGGAADFGHSQQSPPAALYAAALELALAGGAADLPRQDRAELPCDHHLDCRGRGLRGGDSAGLRDGAAQGDDRVLLRALHSLPAVHPLCLCEADYLRAG